MNVPVDVGLLTGSVSLDPAARRFYALTDRNDLLAYDLDRGLLVHRASLDDCPRGTSVSQICCGTGSETLFIAYAGGHVAEISAQTGRVVNYLGCMSSVVVTGMALSDDKSFLLCTIAAGSFRGCTWIRAVSTACSNCNLLAANAGIDLTGGSSSHEKGSSYHILVRRAACLSGMCKSAVRPGWLYALDADAGLFGVDCEAGDSCWINPGRGIRLSSENLQPTLVASSCCATAARDSGCPQEDVLVSLVSLGSNRVQRSWASPEERDHYVAKIVISPRTGARANAYCNDQECQGSPEVVSATSVWCHPVGSGARTAVVDAQTGHVWVVFAGSIRAIASSSPDFVAGTTLAASRWSSAEDLLHAADESMSMFVSFA